MTSVTTEVLGSRGATEKLAQGVFSYVMLSVVLVLFIIAFVTTPIHGNSRFMELASTENASAFIAEGGLNLYITERGDIVADGAWIPEANLNAFLSAEVVRTKGKAVSISADRRLSFASVRALAKRLSDLGVSQIYFVTEDNKMKVLSAAMRPEGHV